MHGLEEHLSQTGRISPQRIWRRAVQEGFAKPLQPTRAEWGTHQRHGSVWAEGHGASGRTRVYGFVMLRVAHAYTLGQIDARQVRELALDRRAPTIGYAQQHVVAVNGHYPAAACARIIEYAIDVLAGHASGSVGGMRVRKQAGAPEVTMRRSGQLLRALAFRTSKQQAHESRHQRQVIIRGGAP